MIPIGARPQPDQRGVALRPAATLSRAQERGNDLIHYLLPLEGRDRTASAVAGDVADLVAVRQGPDEPRGPVRTVVVRVEARGLADDDWKYGTRYLCIRSSDAGIY